MIPYADFTYFGVLLYVVLPTLILGLFGRASWRWAIVATAFMLVVQYHSVLEIRPHVPMREIWLLLAFGVWQWATVRGFVLARATAGVPFYSAVAISLLPLAAAKTLPLLQPATELGFVGMSYVTFRALDVVFCLRDNVITAPGALDLFMFLFFFPTISAGPIDRYRRFVGEWRRKRTRAEFLSDLDAAVHRLFRGFFYKFIIAALIKQYWLEPAASSGHARALLSYMYAYTFYLFFDFAGYSALAIALSYLFGVHTPENFQRPFLARNIRDFWNRWHITLSFWFRDHVYMRFLLAATRGRWFAGKHTAAIVGYFLAFGLMGLWHGLKLHYIVYGLYQAALLSAFHVYSARHKEQRRTTDHPLRRLGAVLLTFQCVAFGLLIFSGRIGAPALPHHLGEVEEASCLEIFGWVWDKHRPNTPVHVDLFDGDRYLTTVVANDYRQDLVEAGYGNGAHGFRLSPPAALRDQRPHQLHFRVTGSKTELTNSPRTITCGR